MGSPKQDAALSYYEKLRELDLDWEEGYRRVTADAGLDKVGGGKEFQRAVWHMVCDVNQQVKEGAGFSGDTARRIAAKAYLLYLRKMIDPAILETIEEVQFREVEVLEDAA